MSGLLQGFVWRAVFPARVALSPKDCVNLNTATAKAMLARIADACHDSGSAMWALGRCIIAEDLSISQSQVTRYQRAFEQAGVLTPQNDGGGRGHYATYQIDVEALVGFVPLERLPGAYRRPVENAPARVELSPERAELSPENPSADGGVYQKPLRGEGRNPSVGADKPLRGRTPSYVRNVSNTNRAREAAGEPDGPPPRGAEGRGNRTAGAGGEAAKGLCGAERGDGAAAPTGGGAPREHGVRGMTELERRRKFEEIFLLDWLYGRAPSGLVFRALDLRETAEPRDIELAALALSGPSLRRVQGFVRWAEACIEGDPETAAPIASVERLIEALANPESRARMARRVNILMRMEFESAAAQAEHSPDSAEHSPDGGGPQHSPDGGASFAPAAEPGRDDPPAEQATGPP